MWETQYSGKGTGFGGQRDCICHIALLPGKSPNLALLFCGAGNLTKSFTHQTQSPGLTRSTLEALSDPQALLPATDPQTSNWWFEKVGCPWNFKVKPDVGTTESC